MFDVRSATGVVVVDVRDDRVVDHRVVHVDPREVVAARVIRRHVDLARPQREPADRGTTSAQRDRCAPVAAADERDQRGRVDRAHVARPRDPAPAVADVSPAAVVRRRKAPGLIVHPGPAPRFLPDPVTIAVRRPIGVDAAGEPDAAVALHRAPAAVLIEVGVTDHVVAHVSQRRGAIQAQVALRAIAVERVVLRQTEQFVVAQIGVVEAHSVPCAQRKAGVLAIGRACAFPHYDRGPCGVGIDVDAIATDAVDGERQRRRRDFVGLARSQAADAQTDRALGQLHLRDAIIQVEDLDAGV